MTERERLEELMKRLDRATAEAWAVYLTTMRGPAMQREIERLLRANRVNDAINLIDSHLKKFTAVFPLNATLVGNSTVESFVPTVRRLQPRIAISFDPANPRAAAKMERQALDFIRREGVKEKDSIRNALTESFQRGSNPRQAARDYRSAVGLTDKQRQHVSNYRAVLERVQDGDISSLTRGLRDKRYDGLIRRAARDGEPLTNEQIDRMVDAYERKYIKYRQEVIARTESARTLNESNYEAFQQVVEQAEFDDDYIERTWQSSRDERTRDSHRHMTIRTVIGMNTPFVTGLGNSAIYPLAETLPAEDCVQCRCTVTNRIRTRDEVEAARQTPPL